MARLSELESGWANTVFINLWDDGSFGTDSPNVDIESMIRLDQLKKTDYICRTISSQRNVTVPKLSGLALDSDANTLYATSSEVKREAADEIPQGGVYMIELNNNYAVHQTWAIPFKSGHTVDDKESKEDAEAIVFAPDGSVLLALEQTQDVVSISGNVLDNNCDYTEKFKISFTGKAEGTDDGLEGIAFFMDKYCFAINETNPLEIVIYDTELGEVKNKITLDLDASKKVTDIAILNDELWLLETTLGQIIRYEIKVGVGSLFSLSPVGFIQLPETIKKNKPDALALDTKKNNIYIGASGQGSANAVSKIYRLRVSNFVISGYETEGNVLSQPMTATELQAESSTLPNRYQNNKGLYATLPTTANNGLTCQAVIADTTNNKTLIMPTSRQINGALVFFYPEDLGYVNRVLDDSDGKKFIGVKVSGETSSYILVSGATHNNEVNVPEVTRYRVSYVTRGYDETLGDNIMVKVNGETITNDDVYVKDSTVTLTANPGEDRNITVLCNKVPVTYNSGYTTTLSGATTFKVIYANNAPFDGNCTVLFNTSNNEEGENIEVSVSGNVIENGDVIMSGNTLTVSATPNTNRKAVLTINNEVKAFDSDTTYSFTLTGHTNINVNFMDVTLHSLGYTLTGYDVASGDSVVIMAADTLLSAGTPSSFVDNTPVSVSASTATGREMTAEFNGSAMEFVDGVYNFTLSSDTSMAFSFETPIVERSFQYAITGFNEESGDTASLTFNGEPVSAGTHTMIQGSQLVFSGTTEIGRQVKLKINGNYYALGADNTYTYTLRNNTRMYAEYSLDPYKQNPYNGVYTVTGLNAALGDSLSVISNGVALVAGENNTIYSGQVITFSATTSSSREMLVTMNSTVLDVESGTTSYRSTGRFNMNFQVQFQDIPQPLTALTNDAYEMYEASTTFDNVNVTEFSGLAFGKDKSTIYGVSNNTNLVEGETNKGGVYRINLTNGTATQIWSVPGWENMSSNKTYEDTEAITVRRVNGADEIYVGFERLQKVVRITGSTSSNNCGYVTVDTFDFGNRGINKDAIDANSGIEGIDFYNENIMFVSNQGDKDLTTNKPYVTLYNISTKTELNSQELSDPVASTEIWSKVTGNNCEFEIADLCYVKSLGELWVMCSERGVIYRYSVNAEATKGTSFLTYVNDIKLPMGTAVTETPENGKTHYTIDKTDKSAIVSNNPEALAVNERTGQVYVGAEGDETIGQIYIFNISDIKKKVETNPDYENFIAESLALKTMAQNYITTNNITGISAEKLVAMYGRSGRYYDENWAEACGSLTDSKYLGFKALADAEHSAFPSRQSVTLPNGETIDVPHFWGALDGDFAGHTEALGWAGDLVTFAQNIAESTTPDAITFPSLSFDAEDWRTDADSYNLYKTYPTNVIGHMKSYWNNITETSRINKFDNGQSIWNRYQNCSDKTDTYKTVLFIPLSILDGLEISRNVSEEQVHVAATKMQTYLDAHKTQF